MIEQARLQLEAVGYRGVSREWVGLQRERSPSSLEGLRDAALLWDLREACPGGTLSQCLPPEQQPLTDLCRVDRCQVSTAAGKSAAVLQLMEARDVSLPEYVPEIERPAKEPSKGVAEGAPPADATTTTAAAAKSNDHHRRRRTLKLVFSDGKRSIRALELDALPELDGELLPGMKFLLQSPVLLRHGLLLLTTGSLSRLGGYIPVQPPASSSFSTNSSLSSLSSLSSYVTPVSSLSTLLPSSVGSVSSPQLRSQDPVFPIYMDLEDD